MQQVSSSLKYYFDVEFTDGTTYTQNAGDVSIIDEKRSCFYDVVQSLEQGKKIKTFLLSDGTNFYSVDLTDGSFETNGARFFMHEKLQKLTDFQIIFYRQHDVTITLERKELGHDILYCIGWQANDENGKVVKRIMEIE